MLKREEKALRTLIKKLREPQAMPYSSDPEFETGVDHGRDDAADELEWVLNDLVELGKNKCVKDHV